MPLLKCFFLFLFLVVFAGACRKDDINDRPPKAKSQLDLIADSIFLFSKEIYYWQDKIANVSYQTFNPRQYIGEDTLDPVPVAQSVIAAVRNYNEWDKEKEYSYAESYEEDATSSSSSTNELSYGFYVEAGWESRMPKEPLNVNDPDFGGWYVSYVFPNSDAGIKGITRGMKLTKVNNEFLGLNNESINILNQMFYDETLKSVDVELIKLDGNILKTTLEIKPFIPTSVIESRIITTAEGHKAGYFVYKFFDKLIDSQSPIDAAFRQFKSAGVSDIILDMRYNNGGYTTTQDYLTNLVAPISVDNSIMYKYYYNEALQKGNYSLMRTRYPGSNSPFTLIGNTENFKTSNSLNTPKVYIIVGENTASSSELLINNLKAVFNQNLVLIGNHNTFGKPVGFFPIDLFKKITFWTVSFLTKNSKEEAVSYNGFTPNYLVYDGVDKAWGDISEDCLKTALNLIDGNNFNPSSSQNIMKRAALLPLKPKKKLQHYEHMLFR